MNPVDIYHTNHIEETNEAENTASIKTGTVPIYRVALVRDGKQQYEGDTVIRTPSDVARLFAAFLDGVDREHFCLIALDTKNKVIGIHTVSVGTLDSAIVHPREVFKPAILLNAATIVVAHNHPSGDPTPSIEDVRITERLRDAGELLGITLLDSIIIGEADRWSSLKQLSII